MLDLGKCIRLMGPPLVFGCVEVYQATHSEPFWSIRAVHMLSEPFWGIRPTRICLDLGDNIGTWEYANCPSGKLRTKLRHALADMIYGKSISSVFGDQFAILTGSQLSLIGILNA